MRIIKSEWHQVEKRYALEFERDMLDEIYPDVDAHTLDLKFQLLEVGRIDFEEILEDAASEDIEFDFDWLDEDDWWTDRKGGYEVTYEVEE
jgi:hypothetical protein